MRFAAQTRARCAHARCRLLGRRQELSSGEDARHGRHGRENIHQDVGRRTIKQSTSFASDFGI